MLHALNSPHSHCSEREAEHGGQELPTHPLPCCPAYPSPQQLLGWRGAQHSLSQLPALQSSLFCRAAKEERSGGIFFSISISTLGKKAAAGNSQLSRAELRGSRAFCISATNPCPAWDFFSLGRLGKLSCGASCSSFPLSVPTSLLHQCKSGASALTSKEQHATLSQQVCLRAESGPWGPHEFRGG